MLLQHSGLITQSLVLINEGTEASFFCLIKQMHFSLALEPNPVIILNTVTMSKVSKVISKQRNDPQLWKHIVAATEVQQAKLVFLSHREGDLSSKYLQSGLSLCEQGTVQLFQVSYLNHGEILLPASNN